MVGLGSGNPSKNAPENSGVGIIALEVQEHQKNSNHQTFQVPKMEVLNLIAGYFGGGFSLT